MFSLSLSLLYLYIQTSIYLLHGDSAVLSMFLIGKALSFFVLFFFFVFSWVKATVPRYRYDQLMRLGWKIFLPISLIWVFLISGYLMLTRYS